MSEAHRADEYVDVPSVLVTTLSQGGTLPATAPTSPRPFPDIGPRLGRYELTERLGAGGFGVVYKANDPRDGSTVAIKTLHNVEPSGIASLKREFRALAAVRHPNLVELGELGVDNGLWYLTMEYVEGVDFVSFVRPGTIAPPNLALLRLAIGQLALAIHASHDAGLLHLDIKPSNVLVTPQGRVVVLDFGLATHLRESPDSSSESRARGTPAFMAPEQVRGAELGEATDWYAFAGVLFKGLSGRHPFESGSGMAVMAQKLMMDPRPVTELAPDADPELASLTMALLAREPYERPSGREVLRRLHLGREPLRTGRRLGLVGREEELAVLRASFERASSGRAIAVIEGPSGVGKSRLADAFVEELDARDDTFVLRARCFERAHVPYRAFDGLVDELATRLVALDGEAKRTLATAEVGEALRVFPSLGQVAELDNARSEIAADPAEARHRAFVGLERLLEGAAAGRVVVLAIDDLQWSDEDSALLMSELVREGRLPRLLVVGTARTDLAHGPVHTLFEELARRDPDLVRDIPVSPLTETQARTLSASLFDEPDPERDRAIARRSRGLPLLLEELASQERAEEYFSAEVDGGDDVDVADLVLARLAHLPPELRSLVELVSVADRPVPTKLVADALDESTVDEPLEEVLARLGRYQLLRVGAEIEPYHGQTRQSVLAQIHPDSLPRRHRALATAHERQERPDHGALAHHYRGAGERARAGEHAIAAARAAERVLAFAQAAEHYADALGDLPPERAPELLRGQADALANAGRGEEAGEAYLACVPHFPEDSVELRRLAGENFLTSASIERGGQVLSTLLEERGVWFPHDRKRALLGLVKNLAWLRLRGTRFETVPDARIAPEVHERLALLLAANRVYANFDPIVGGYFALEALSRSLAAGHERGAILGIDSYGVTTCYGGTRSAEKRGHALLDQAAALARASEDPVLRARVGFGYGVAATALGRFAEAVEHLERTTAALERCVGVSWELAIIENTRVQSLIWLGRLDEARDRTRILMRRAEQTGDHYTSLVGTVLDAMLRLAAGHPDEARASVTDMLAQWTTEEFTFQHLFANKTAIWADLYQGHVDAAEARLRAMAPRLRRSGLLSLQLLRAEASVLEGSVALWRLHGGHEVSLKRLRSLTRWLEKTGRPYARGYAAMLRAGLARHQGRARDAEQEGNRAARLFDRAHMEVHAAAMRVWLGVPGADAPLRAQGIAEPECWARIYLPL